MNHVMMSCGCTAQAVCTSKDGEKIDPPIPCCVVHDCYEINEPPDLTGRKAKCTHCHKTKESSLDLPFFEYHGDGSRTAAEHCKCGYAWIAHQPRWRARINVSRRWFKIDPYKSVYSKEFHAPLGIAKSRAESEVDAFRKMTHSKETMVYSADLLDLQEIRSPLKCKTFVAIGPQELDRYYCGCRGWD